MELPQAEAAAEAEAEEGNLDGGAEPFLRWFVGVPKNDGGLPCSSSVQLGRRRTVEAWPVPDTAERPGACAGREDRMTSSGILSGTAPWERERWEGGGPGTADGLEGIRCLDWDWDWEWDWEAEVGVGRFWK